MQDLLTDIQVVYLVQNQDVCEQVLYLQRRIEISIAEFILVVYSYSYDATSINSAFHAGHLVDYLAFSTLVRSRIFPTF